MLLALLPLYEFVHHRRYHRMTALFIYFATTKSGALGGFSFSPRKQALRGEAGPGPAVGARDGAGHARAVAPLPRLGHRLTAPLSTVLGQKIPANVKLPSPRAHRSSDDPPARKEPPAHER